MGKKIQEVELLQAHSEQSPKPLIQAMDQDVLKSMLAHKNSIIGCFLNNHPSAKDCINGSCDHEKIGEVMRKIDVNEENNKVSLIEVDAMKVCVYVMPVLGHLIDYDLFSSFISDEPVEAPSPTVPDKSPKVRGVAARNHKRRTTDL